MKKQNQLEEMLLDSEVLICLLALFIFISAILIATLFPLSQTFKTILIIGGTVGLTLMGMWALKIEQIVGYYKCSKCGHYHVPTYLSLFLAPHIGRTRYMSCPDCNQRSWQKKVLTKTFMEDMEEKNKAKEDTVSVSFGERKQEEK